MGVKVLWCVSRWSYKSHGYISQPRWQEVRFLCTLQFLPRAKISLYSMIMKHSLRCFPLRLHAPLLFAPAGWLFVAFAVLGPLSCPSLANDLFSLSLIFNGLETHSRNKTPWKHLHIPFLVCTKSQNYSAMQLEADLSSMFPEVTYEKTNTELKAYMLRTKQLLHNNVHDSLVWWFLLFLSYRHALFFLFPFVNNTVYHVWIPKSWGRCWP